MSESTKLDIEKAPKDNKFDRAIGRETELLYRIANDLTGIPEAEELKKLVEETAQREDFKDMLLYPLVDQIDGMISDFDQKTNGRYRNLVQKIKETSHNILPPR